MIDTTFTPRVTIRFIQGMIAFLASLPADGKAREIFSLALDLNEGPWLEKIGPPTDPDSDEGFKSWLESVFVQGGLTKEEQRIVYWQNHSENMSAAVREVRAVVEKLSPE